MIIQELTVGIVQTRCYILSAENGTECIVIDPGAEADRIRDELRLKGIEIIDTPQGAKWRRV